MILSDNIIGYLFGSQWNIIEVFIKGSGMCPGWVGGGALGDEGPLPVFERKKEFTS